MRDGTARNLKVAIIRNSTTNLPQSKPRAVHR